MLSAVLKLALTAAFSGPGASASHVPQHAACAMEEHELSYHCPFMRIVRPPAFDIRARAM